VARYGKEHKEASRRRIVEAAGRRFKRDGIDGSGIATLMADAGLTNGAFYAHFDSKDDLVATTVAVAGRSLTARRRDTPGSIR
jgi:AcrR family transcriptional regulator